jgi:[NiFe] hydrogenase diaphorase moiety large subunit
MSSSINQICNSFGNDSQRLMDILNNVQEVYDCISEEAIQEISSCVEISKSKVEETLSFYHFFSKTPRGKYTVYLNNSLVSNMKGRAKIKKVFEDSLGIKFGQVSGDGSVGLFDTACIGMNDQEPAAIINDVVFTNLSEEKVKEIVDLMKQEKEAKQIALAVGSLGDGSNSSSFVQSIVQNNIKNSGEVILRDYEVGIGLRKAIEMGSDETIKILKDSNLRGRGGAGFPTGLKWELCKKEVKDNVYILCNADEGEPGTFKDRVLLTEFAKLVFEGMTIAGITLGAKEGVLYLRREYYYLKDYLEGQLGELRSKNLLGNKIGGKDSLNFDIRIQFGAGAYVCGEESALIESCEGKRGEPRNKPPFPIAIGYKNQPTIINNVETFATLVKIIEKGASWYKGFGTEQSTGTKLLSISGDCGKPGVYEVEWGVSIQEVLDMVDAKDTQAVVVGGPSGSIISSQQFGRKIAYEDLGTGGAIIIIGQGRDLLREVVPNFMEFFLDESCGSCVPCRALTRLIFNKFQKVVRGNGAKSDLEEITNLCEMTWKVNRCGLGKSATNPIYNVIKNFPELFDKLVQDKEYVSEFDLKKATKRYEEVVGR